jgi:cell wall-associated NlpC family hydrolase
MKKKTLLSQSKLTLKASVCLLIFSMPTFSNAEFRVAQLSLGNGAGPASFSQNWGADSSYNPNQRQVITMHPTAMAKHANTTAAYIVTPSFSQAEAPSLPSGSVLSQPTVPGRRAVLHHGIAYAPQDAPTNVKRAIWATNTLRNKPYVWGGGHDSFSAYGYDCSGTVSFALHYAGLLSAPLDSRSLMSFGESGPGRWMTVYARNGHTWMVIAGLRLDTTGFYGDEGPRFRADSRSAWGFTARHPVGL